MRDVALSWLVASVVVLGCAGCSEGGAPGPTMDPPSRARDSGWPPPGYYDDAGPGPSPWEDEDAGIDEEVETGSCESEVIDPPFAPVCAAATRTCLEGCKESEDDTCMDACMAADPMPDACGECLEDAYLACANAAGCQTQFDEMMCCIEGCADPEAEACYTTTCGAESAAYDGCIEAHDDACSGMADTACFP
jgi:hypothetical protein